MWPPLVSHFDAELSRCWLSYSFRAPKNYSSKLKPDIGEKCVHQFAAVNVFQALAWNQSGSAGRDGDVFRQRRPVTDADARVKSDAVTNRRLKQDLLERLGAFEAQVVHVNKPAHFRRDIEIRTDVREKNTGIHEIGLAFIFARTQIWKKAVARIQRDARARQPNALAIPQAEDSAREFREIIDGIKSARVAARRIRRPGSIKERTLQPEPVAIHRDFERRHLRVDRHRPSRDGIKAVVPQRLIKSMGQIHSPDVAVAGPTDVRGMNAVRLDHAARKHFANRRRTHEKTVVVVMDGGIVFVVVNAQLRGVTLEQEILAKHVGDDHLLIAQRHRIQAAVGILFEEIEVRDVILPPIRIEIAEDADAWLFFHKQETAEVAIESLNAGAHRDKIVVRADILDLEFAEGFLQTDVCVETRGAFGHVGVDDSAFLHIEIIQTDSWSDSDAPIDRTERSIAMKQVE